MRKLSLSTKFYLYDKTNNNNGEYPIYCRILANRTKSEFSTYRFVLTSKWDDAKQRAKGNPELNGYLAHLESKINSAHTKLFEAGEIVEAKKIKNIILRIDESSIKLLDYFDEFVDRIGKLPDEFSRSTVKKYQTIKRHLISYLRYSRKESILLHNYNLKHVNEFEEYLRSIVGLSINTATKYLKQLKAIFNRAIQHQHISRNPFEGYRFKTTPIKTTYLDAAELKQLEDFKMINDSLERVRDVFLFSCYTGLRFSDVIGISVNELKNDLSGNQWLDLKQVKKTKQSLKIPLLSKAARIIHKYEQESKITGNLLPGISNQKTNAYLKVLADLVGIDKHLTFHVARHTFATTITTENGTPREYVTELLGHANSASTQIYARMTEESLNKEIKRLNKLIN